MDIIDTFRQQRPLVISGPCSAETRQQVLSVAQGLAATDRVNLFRAGVWKPRTRPGMFEGIGADALPWLREAKALTGLPMSIEVATGKHVEEALAAGIDVLWIGARTTVNPFSVQEIADALAGSAVPVFVKNPINADVELWSGAVERLQKMSVTDIGIIHRGFSSYGNTRYRNAPMWQIPIEMKRRYAGMPLICDPSHICGNRHMLQDVAQTSVDLDYDGLMIETHPDPDNAWSDSKQQITPAQLTTLLDNLIWRKGSTDTGDFTGTLAGLREKIDQIDDELIELLAQRMKVSDEIGDCKRENNITILQAKRWNDIYERCMQKGIPSGLSSGFLKRYLDAVHLESIDHQNKVMNDVKPKERS